MGNICVLPSRKDDSDEHPASSFVVTTLDDAQSGIEDHQLASPGKCAVNKPSNDDEFKPAAKDDEPYPSNNALESTQTEILKLAAKTKSDLWRHAYADAFLAKCDVIDPTKDFDLPLGTYVCSWMPLDPQPETYFQCGNASFDNRIKRVMECGACGKRAYEHSEEFQDHLWTVGGCPVTQRLIEETEAGIAAERERLNISFLRLDVLTRINALYDKLSELRSDDQWKHIPAEPEPDDAQKVELKYLASRCYIKEMPLFGAVVMRRPNVYCTYDNEKKNGFKKLDFGSHAFQASLLPSREDVFAGFSPCGIQTTWDHYDDSLNPEYRRPKSYRLGLCYTKDQVWAYNHRVTWRDEGQVYRPFTPYFAIPSGGLNSSIALNHDHGSLQQHGGCKADVWTTEKREICDQIKHVLLDLAEQTNDFPLPRYQMIIDPNQFVRRRKSDDAMVWVPCEFDVSSDGSGVSLVGDDRAHWMNPAVIGSVATPVLNAALPLLSKLTKPYLLLEGQRLQVVVKAQSITVPKKQPDDDPPEYIGLWHIDGQHEPVAAVVLYYYDVDDALVGGNMEFMDRRPLAVLGVGDTDMPEDLPPGSLRQALRPGKKSGGPLIPNCSVPIKTGTMLVFSNYQMAHRVLRMVNTSQDRAASRKFVAMFIMDPGAERLVPAKCHLALPYLYKRTLTGKSESFPSDAHQDFFPANVADLVMEFLGIVPSTQERLHTRNAMLHSQLQPTQCLGNSEEMVCGTGNGCLTMIGWIDSILLDHTRHQREHGPPWAQGESLFAKPEKRVNALNYPPKEVGRGLSETLSIPSDDLTNTALFFDTADERNKQLDADFEKMRKPED